MNRRASLKHFLTGIFGFAAGLVAPAAAKTWSPFEGDDCLVYRLNDRKQWLRIAKEEVKPGDRIILLHPEADRLHLANAATVGPAGNFFDRGQLSYWPVKGSSIDLLNLAEHAPVAGVNAEEKPA